MLSSTPRGGAGRRFAAGARAFCLLVSLTASLAAAAPSTAPPLPAGPSPADEVAALAARAASPPTNSPLADLTAELQRLADATDRIEPSSPDATARLKVVVRGLIEVVKADRRELGALRAGASAPVRARVVRRSSRKKSAAVAAASGRPAPAAGAPGAPEGTGLASATAPAGAFFGKRGLKKLHRAGCVFGERIHAEDRIYFKTVQEATAAGYEACKICRPGG
jgi:hypothetical protein